MDRVDGSVLPAVRRLLPRHDSGWVGREANLHRLSRRPRISRLPFPLPVPGRDPGGDPEREIWFPPPGGRRGRRPSSPGPPSGLDGPVSGLLPSRGRPGPDPSPEIFPARLQPPRADRLPPGPKHRVGFRSALPSPDPGEVATGPSSPLPAGGQRARIVRRSGGEKSPAGDPPPGRRLHLGGHRRGMRPRLEKGGGGAYSGFDGRPHRPLIPFRTETGCPHPSRPPPFSFRSRWGGSE